MNKNKVVGTFLIIISAMAFGTIPLFSNLAYKEGMSVNGLLFLRFFSASVLLWIYIFIKKLDFKVSKHAFIHLALISFIGYTISSSGLFYSYKYISSSLATIIFFSYPIMVVIYEMIISKKIDFKKLFCLATTSIGLVLIICTGPVKVNLIGVFLAFCAAAGYSYFCIGLGDKSTQSLNSMVVSAYVMSFCSISYVIQCGITKHSLIPTNGKVLCCGVLLGFVCSILSTITLNEGIKRIGVGTSVILSSIEPVFVCILGVFCLHEIITLNMIIGGIFIVLSVVFLQTPTSKFSFKKAKNYN